MSDEQAVSIWPCTHGDVLVEWGRMPKNYKCAECGATASRYLPASHVEQLERELAQEKWINEFDRTVPIQEAREEIERLERRVAALEGAAITLDDAKRLLLWHDAASSYDTRLYEGGLPEDDALLKRLQAFALQPEEER